MKAEINPKSKINLHYSFIDVTCVYLMNEIERKYKKRAKKTMQQNRSNEMTGLDGFGVH